MRQSLKCHTSPPPNPWGLCLPRPPDYRSIGHAEFPKFQTGSFAEWKAPLVSETFPSYNVENTACNARRCHVKRSYGKISSALNYRDLGNWASRPFHMNTSKKLRRDFGNRAESGLQPDSCEEALNWDQFRYIFKKFILGCEVWGNKTKGIIPRFSNE